MDIKVHEDYEQINKENVETHKRTGTRKPRAMRYRCVICGEPACIDNSVSCCGHRLMHTDCAKRIFGTDIDGTRKLFKWMGRGY